MLRMVKKYSFAVIPIVLAWVNLTSCNKLNPPEIIPCYGHVDSISYSFNDSLVTPRFKEGSSYSYITDAWVYLDDNPIGAFEMPCTFPMITGNGTHQIKIYPGIKNGGTSNVRTKYPWYSFYTIDVNLQQGSIVKFTPSVTYASYAKLKWIENFESTNSIVKASNSDTGMFITHTNVFQGGGSGRAELDSTGPGYFKTNFIGYSDSMTLIDDGATQVFLEINYNCNTQFTVGVSYTADHVNFTQLPPTVYVYSSNSTWKKMYIGLVNTIAPYTHPPVFKVYFQMQRPSKSTVAFLMLDNIKLVE